MWRRRGQPLAAFVFCGEGQQKGAPMSLENAPQRSKPKSKSLRLLAVQTVAERQDESVATVWRKIRLKIYPALVYPDGKTGRMIEDELDAVNERALKARDKGKVQGRLKAKGLLATKA